MTRKLGHETLSFNGILSRTTRPYNCKKKNKLNLYSDVEKDMMIVTFVD